MKIKSLIFVMLFPSILKAELPNPCDLKKESVREKSVMECASRKDKSLKTWSELEQAKIFVLDSLSSGKASSLKPYIGCDASDPSAGEFLCDSHAPIISEKHIQSLLDKMGDKRKEVLNNVKWINYGVKKDIYLLCSSKFRIKINKNYCGDSVEEVPIVEIRKGSNGYYIYGVVIPN